MEIIIYFQSTNFITPILVATTNADIRFTHNADGKRLPRRGFGSLQGTPR